MTQLKTVLEIEGYKIEINFIKGCPTTNNDLKLSELIKEEATKLGLTVVSQRANLGGMISRVSRSMSKVRCFT